MTNVSLAERRETHRLPIKDNRNAFRKKRARNPCRRREPKHLETVEEYAELDPRVIEAYGGALAPSFHVIKNPTPEFREASRG